MVVDVAAVHRVPMTVVDVVEVVAVLNRDVATPLAMLVLMRLVLSVVRRLALVHVRVVRAMQMPVVHVVQVVAVGHRDVTAVIPVQMLVVLVRQVSRGHECVVPSIVGNRLPRPSSAASAGEPS